MTNEAATGKHTLGPWVIAKDVGPASLPVIQDSDQGRDLCWLRDGDDSFDESPGAVPLAEVEANARLIAAAPELLAALEAILEHAELMERFNGGTWSVGETVKERARGAIARARGEQEPS